MGMVASDNVNAERAKDIGQKVLETLIGRNVTDVSFKRQNQIVQLSTKQSPGGVIRRMDSSILFQCLILLASNSSLFYSDFFKYVLCSYPASLLDSCSIPLKWSSLRHDA
jgi:hypothetical protein